MYTNLQNTLKFFSSTFEGMQQVSFRKSMAMSVALGVISSLAASITKSVLNNKNIVLLSCISFSPLFVTAIAKLYKKCQQPAASPPKKSALDPTQARQNLSSSIVPSRPPVGSFCKHSSASKEWKKLTNRYVRPHAISQMLESSTSS